MSGNRSWRISGLLQSLVRALGFTHWLVVAAVVLLVCAANAGCSGDGDGPVMMPGNVTYYKHDGDWDKSGCTDVRKVRLRLENHGKVGDWEDWKEVKGYVRPCKFCDAELCDCQDHCERHCRDGDKGPNENGVCRCID